mmetsp:Transcript_25772/g.76070  ORF Transcript_25772/g.76070 Transcript_25772/m.76070 type:complete len:278 (-) Transcript_25772:796-1629(-)
MNPASLYGFYELPFGKAMLPPSLINEWSSSFDQSPLCLFLAGKIKWVQPRQYAIEHVTHSKNIHFLVQNAWRIRELLRGSNLATNTSIVVFAVFLFFWIPQHWLGPIEVIELHLPRRSAEELTEINIVVHYDSVLEAVQFRQALRSGQRQIQLLRGGHAIFIVNAILVVQFLRLNDRICRHHVIHYLSRERFCRDGEGAVTMNVCNAWRRRKSFHDEGVHPCLFHPVHYEVILVRPPPQHFQRHVRRSRSFTRTTIGSTSQHERLTEEAMSDVCDVR